MAIVNEYAVGPSVKIPSPKTVTIDLIEFWCYSVLVEAPPSEIFRRSKEWERILAQHENELKIQGYGRIRNRIGIAALVSDFCGRDANSSAESALSNQKSSFWGRLMDDLDNLRHGLLRFDRDAMQGDDENDNLDDDLAYLPMFDEAYNELLSMIKLQHAVTTLREQLQEETKKPSPTNGTAQRRMSQIIGKYEGIVRKECPSDNHVLLRFLRRDLLKAHKKGETKALPKHIIEDLKKVMEKDDISFSLRLLQRKTQVLLRDWSDQNLAPPALVRLGYGGLTTTNATQNDQQTVSSWGTYSDEDVKAEREKFINSEPLDARKEADPEDLRRAARAVAESDLSEDYLTPDEEEPKVSTAVNNAAIVRNRATSNPTRTGETSSHPTLVHDTDTRRRHSAPHPRRKHKTAMKKQAMTPPPKVVNVVAVDLVEQFNGYRFNDVEGVEDVMSGEAASRKRKKYSGTLSGSDDDSFDGKRIRSKNRRMAKGSGQNHSDGYEGENEDVFFPSREYASAPASPVPGRRGATAGPKDIPPYQKEGASATLNQEQEWTVDEESAVRKGIRDHGTDWDSIRDEYSSILGTRGRTSLRRKYLEMKVRGDLDV